MESFCIKRKFKKENHISVLTYSFACTYLLLYTGTRKKIHCQVNLVARLMYCPLLCLSVYFLFRKLSSAHTVTMLIFAYERYLAYPLNIRLNFFANRQSHLNDLKLQSIRTWQLQWKWFKVIILRGCSHWIVRMSVTFSRYGWDLLRKTDEIPHFGRKIPSMEHWFGCNYFTNRCGMWLW